MWGLLWTGTETWRCWRHYSGSTGSVAWCTFQRPSWTTSLVQLDGFHLVRAERNTRESGKEKGGGIALFVKDKWRNPGHIHVKEQWCTRDIELLAVRIWPYYLLKEFSCHCNNVHPSLGQHRHSLQACPQCCGTASESILKTTGGAYSSSPLNSLGRSDHNLVHLHPVYTLMVNNKPWVTLDLRALLLE